MTAACAIAQLHPKIIHWLHQQGWQELRSIQQQAILEFSQHSRDLIITARTAGGKTEAAFLPILSALLCKDPIDRDGLRAIYVGPMRALINDQFRRMESLCHDLDIAVHRWHGEVSAYAKRKLTESPSGILLITPESIESLFINRTPHLNRLFESLDYCVIDELHIFPNTERGQHLRSLLHRLELVRQTRIRRIGLSATLPNSEVAAQWLRSEDAGSVCLIAAPERRSQFLTGIFGYRAFADSTTDAALPSAIINSVPKSTQCAIDLAKHHASSTALIFANTRAYCDEAAAQLRENFANSGQDDSRIHVHHASVARNLRLAAEQALLYSKNTLCFCTSTLELGVDLGDVKAVAHIGAPHSATSAAQRMGRSGRRPNDPTIFRQYLLLNLQSSTVSEEFLLFPLLRAIAVVDCYRQGWIEPTTTQNGFLSTLVQQVICTIVQHYGCTAKMLYQTLCASGNFHWINAQIFRQILHQLGKCKIIAQLGDRSLILGSTGEACANSMEIYTAFPTQKDWTVMHFTCKVGVVSTINTYGPGDLFLLAGKHWKVEDVIKKGRVLMVEPVKKSAVPKYPGNGMDTCQQLVLRMKAVLDDPSYHPSYCNPAALQLLKLARERYRNEVENLVIIGSSENSSRLWTWGGSTINRTIAVMLRASGIDLRARYGVASVTSRLTARRLFESCKSFAHVADWSKRLQQILGEHFHLVEDLQSPQKYDDYLPDTLLAQQFIQTRLDIPGARDALQQVPASLPEEAAIKGL